MDLLGGAGHQGVISVFLRVLPCKMAYYSKCIAMAIQHLSRFKPERDHPEQFLETVSASLQVGPAAQEAALPLLIPLLRRSHWKGPPPPSPGQGGGQQWEGFSLSLSRHGDKKPP